MKGTDSRGLPQACALRPVTNDHAGRPHAPAVTNSFILLPAMVNETETPIPTEIKLHQKSRLMEITFAKLGFDG
jgi:hypothetical protein